MIEEINSKKCNESIVNMAADILSRAKSGDIQNLVAFGTDAEGNSWNQLSVHTEAMVILGESRLVERDLIDLHCQIRKEVIWDYCE